MSALVYQKTIRGAATHAIVIGVGYYAHLKGGSGKKFRNAVGLGQLTSPPLSAHAVARWLIEEYHHPQKPLSSVSLLCSDSNNRGFEFTVNGHKRSAAVLPATMNEVQKAIWDWHALGNTNAKNLLLFYFCGHGVGLGPELGLLLSDFGSVPLAPLNGAIDFKKFWRGMDECQAREQCYFIDACRVASHLLIQNAGFAGQPVVQSTGAINRTGRMRQGGQFFSTLPGTQAYSKPGKPSMYTTALIEALAGAASGDEDGPWRISTGRLQDSLAFLLSEACEQLQVAEPQIISSDEVTPVKLNVIKSTPTVPVIVSCDPSNVNSKATLSCKNGSLKKSRRPSSGPWRLRLPSGLYDFDARIKSKSFPKHGHPIRPIYSRVDLKVKL